MSSSNTRGCRRVRISQISAMHYAKLVFRSLIFLVMTADYILLKRDNMSLQHLSQSKVLRWVVWAVFALEMTLRFFPSRMESMGCQKQFARNYMPTGRPLQANRWDRPRLWVVLAWFALNGLIGAAYFAGWFDRGILILISLAYSVCDMICILFFCPFQTWFLKNKCCGSCPIYNWDYAMMFTPLLFVGGLWSWSLLALSLGLLLSWEITYKRHPERFYEHTNDALSCANCREKLCQHKRQLRHFLKTRGRRIIR